MCTIIESPRNTLFVLSVVAKIQLAGRRYRASNLLCQLRRNQEDRQAGQHGRDRILADHAIDRGADRHDRSMART